MEVTPLREIDGYGIGAGGVGPLTERLETLFHDVVRGKDPRYQHWVTPV
jgi:branched-chain amino acid aminotransferase